MIVTLVVTIDTAPRNRNPMSASAKATDGVDTAATEHSTQAANMMPTVSSPDHMLHLDQVATLNTAFDSAVKLGPQQLLASPNDMYAVMQYVAYVESIMPDSSDLLGGGSNVYKAQLSTMREFKPSDLWEHQYVVLMLLYTLPYLRRVICCNAPYPVQLHFVDTFETSMEAFLWGKSQKQKVDQYALTPLELTMRMTTKLEQSYYIT